jgi:hypothetical protein
MSAFDPIAVIRADRQQAAMVIRFSVAVLSMAWVSLGACGQEPPRCLGISKNEAIMLAIESEKQLRLNETEQRKFISDEVRHVELRRISDGSDIGALVTFRGDGTEAPKALVYGDCVVEWTA